MVENQSVAVTILGDEVRQRQRRKDPCIYEITFRYGQHKSEYRVRKIQPPWKLWMRRTANKMTSEKKYGDTYIASVYKEQTAWKLGEFTNGNKIRLEIQRERNGTGCWCM